MNVIKKDAKSERGYDMRAQPRRRAKEENEQPLFLKKAFNMIDTCPDHLGTSDPIRAESMTIQLSISSRLSHFSSGGWSANGDTFIVKDIKKFSDQIIPTVFKHKNFSSFVRQLNFCKISIDPYFYQSHLNLSYYLHHILVRPSNILCDLSVP